MSKLKMVFKMYKEIFILDKKVLPVTVLVSVISSAVNTIFNSGFISL